MAGRIFDHLAHHYETGEVFIDIEDIPFGVNARKHVEGKLNKCNALLVIIGRRWIGQRRCRIPRLHEENDWVRFELETALQRGIPVIPVLVEGASMPLREQLPERLHDCALYNAATIDSGRDFRAHVQRLIASLNHLLFLDGHSLSREHLKEATLPGKQVSLRDGQAVPTFAEMVDEVIASLGASWKSGKQREQWRTTLSRDCELISRLPVDQITTEHVLAILKPLWTSRLLKKSKCVSEDRDDKLLVGGVSIWPHQ